MPREHGAWGLLLIPLLTGACLGLLQGGSASSLAPLCIVALALFWLRTPVESWAGATPIRPHTPREVRVVRMAVLALSAVSAAALVWLFWNGRNAGLLWIGFVAASAFLAQAAVKRFRGARTAAQMVGSAGLTSTAAAAYYVTTGRLDTIAWTLWAANLLFALNQIHFVQLRIHAARAASRREKLHTGRAFFAGQILLTVLLAASCASGLFRWYAALAFLPLLVRGFAWFAAAPKPLHIHALGKSELLCACLFGALVIIGTALA